MAPPERRRVPGQHVQRRRQADDRLRHRRRAGGRGGDRRHEHRRGRVDLRAAASNFAIARLTADGSLDNTFSSDGKHAVSLGADDVATSVAIQGDGRIVVGGYTDANGDDDFAVVRLNADGSLDNSFGGDGKAVADFPGEQQAFALALQPDGRIVMAGSTNILAGDLDLAVVRFAGDTAGLSVAVTDGVRVGDGRRAGVVHDPGVQRRS